MAVPCCPVHCDDDDDAEMEKRVDTGDISVLIFLAVLIFWLLTRKQTINTVLKAIS